MVAEEHPAVSGKVAASQCVECHAEHAKGGVVHAAHLDCFACHESRSADGKTSVTLVRPKSELCLGCHKKSEQKTLHGPYAGGACIQCHNPHVSPQAKLLRAAPSVLCAGCHVIDNRGTKIDYAAKSVALPWNRTLTTAEYEKAPKIELDDGGVTGHPVPVHPVQGMNSRGSGQITCLTCHHQHSADAAYLVRKSEKGTSICTTCHPGMGS